MKNWLINTLEFFKRKDIIMPVDSAFDDKLDQYKLLSKAANKIHYEIRRERFRRLMKYHKYAIIKLFIFVPIICTALYFITVNFYPTFIFVDRIQPESLYATVSSDSIVSIKRVINPQLLKYFDFIAASEVTIKKGDTLASYKIKCYDSSSTAIGRYQMNNGARADIGLGGVSQSVFLNWPELQDIAMFRLLKVNREYMKDFLHEYDGKVINGYYLTEPGMLSLAHALGAGGAMKWIKDGCIVSELPAGAPHADRRLTLQRYKIDIK
jgi:hypothetical protein